MFDKKAYEEAQKDYNCRLKAWELGKKNWDKYNSAKGDFPYQRPDAPKEGDYNYDIDNTEEPQKNNFMQLVLEEIKNSIVRKESLLSAKKSPDSVIIIFDLIAALYSYTGKIKPETDAARQLMIKDLFNQLKDFLTTTEKNFNPEKVTHRAAQDKFEQACTKLMNENYKYLAAEPTLWNIIKDLFNDFCKFIGLKPKGRFVDSTLDSTEILKSGEIRARFLAVKKQGIITEADNEMENPLTATL